MGPILWTTAKRKVVRATWCLSGWGKRLVSWNCRLRAVGSNRLCVEFVRRLCIHCVKKKGIWAISPGTNDRSAERARNKRDADGLEKAREKRGYVRRMCMFVCVEQIERNTQYLPTHPIERRVRLKGCGFAGHWLLGERCRVVVGHGLSKMERGGGGREFHSPVNVPPFYLIH